MKKYTYIVVMKYIQNAYNWPYQPPAPQDGVSSCDLYGDATSTNPRGQLQNSTPIRWMIQYTRREQKYHCLKCENFSKLLMLRICEMYVHLWIKNLTI